MKRIILILNVVFSLMFISCSPQYFTMNIELRSSSKSGIELNNKSIALVYLDNGVYIDSIFNASISQGFAQSLEEDYYRGNKVIDIYAIAKEEGSVYSTKDSLVNLLVSLNKDVIFFMDEPQINELEIEKSKKVYLPYSRTMYIYDSYSSDDKVHTVNYKSKLLLPIKAKEVDVVESAVLALPKASAMAGSTAANKYHSSWTNHKFTILYYDSSNYSKWYKASIAATEYRWKDAMDLWISLLDTKNMLKKSALEYNIALACTVLGQKELALEWLDSSDNHQKLSVGIELRKILLASEI